MILCCLETYRGMIDTMEPQIVSAEATKPVAPSSRSAVGAQPYQYGAINAGVTEGQEVSSTAAPRGPVSPFGARQGANVWTSPGSW